MYQKYFPACTVDGNIEPPINHLGTIGAVPHKCGHCDHLFEGGCRRFINEIGDYLHLDYGSCGIQGPTDPIIYEDQYITSKVEVPRKCSDCGFLKFDRIHGFDCLKDINKWGDLHRGLDWGTWQPDGIYLQLPHPKVTTKQLSTFAQKNNLVEFIKEHRRINPGLSIEETKVDFNHFRSIIEKHQ
jgi:hypothetical protein